MRLLLDGLVNNSQRAYWPGVEHGSVTVDEQLYPFRGRCRYIQYIPSKPAKYGLKFWALCDSTTRYCWKIEMYTGRDDRRDVPLGSHVVLQLANGLNGSGINITMDNFFSSLALARELRTRGMTLLGTVKHNKREVCTLQCTLYTYHVHVHVQIFVIGYEFCFVAYLGSY